MIHSLEQFYAKALEFRAKYGIDPEKYTLETGCEIKEGDGLTCKILLYYQGRLDVLAEASAPETALAEFERQLARKNSKVLDDITFEVEDIYNAETDIPEEDQHHD